MKHRLFLLLILGLNSYVLSAQSPARTGKDYAIFFYVTDFDDKGWEQLPETRVEVNAIASELETNYGFKVEIVPNPTKQGILDKITEVNGRRYGEEDQVLFFFSTHGYFSKDTDRGYLVPKDGKSNDLYGRSWISYDDLGSYITLNPSKHILVGLDACYSGAFGDRYKGKPEDTPGASTADCATQISRALSYDSRLYFTSGSRDQRTPAKSLFADRWLRTLRQGAEKGLIRTNDLRYQLSTIENPLPEGGSFTSKHKAGGDFIFVHKTSCAPTFTPKVDPNQYNQRQEDINAYNAIKNNPTISNCQAYLTDFPRGDFRQEVAQQLQQLQDEQEWQYATLKGTKAAYQNYLQLYPNGLHANEARQRINAPVTTTPTVKPPDHMVFVQGGPFEMGDVFGDGESREKPTHSVTVSDFYMGRHEITVSEFSQFIASTKYKTDADKEGTSYVYTDGTWKEMKNINWRHDETGQVRPSQAYEHPVIHVSWNDAIAYCNWRSEQENLHKVYTISRSTVTANWSANGYRLPTEAEWEYAARSRGKKEKWAGTSEESKLMAYANGSGDKDGHQYTSPVSSFRANDLGLYDMSGNVYEWCWDWYGTYSSGAQTDPRGPSTGSDRVLRGDSWYGGPARLRCAFRAGSTPGFRDGLNGFRLSRAAR